MIVYVQSALFLAGILLFPAFALLAPATFAASLKKPQKFRLWIRWQPLVYTIFSGTAALVLSTLGGPPDGEWLMHPGTHLICLLWCYLWCGITLLVQRWQAKRRKIENGSVDSDANEV